jgi:indole-3-glycerol phosphate synthase
MVISNVGCAQESAMNVGFAGISGFLVGEQILSRA